MKQGVCIFIDNLKEVIYIIFSLRNIKYQVKKHWGEIHKERLFYNISGISSDKNGYIYVLQRDNPIISIFTNEGEIINKWYNKEIDDGHYFSITPDKEIAVVSMDHHIVTFFDKSGKKNKIVGEYDNPGEYGFPFNHPTDITVNHDGDYFVSDGYGNARVHHFDKCDKLIKSWGESGKGKGQFSVPHAILLDRKQRVLVADRYNNRVQIFDKNGKYLMEINNLYHPMDICEDNNGFIYITDQTPSLSLYNIEGRLMGRCKTLDNSHGLTVDEKGNIYLSGANNITKLIRLE